MEQSICSSHKFDGVHNVCSNFYVCVCVRERERERETETETEREREGICLWKVQYIICLSVDDLFD